MDDLVRKPSDPLSNVRRKRMIKAAIGLLFGAMFGLMWGAALSSQALGLIIGAGFGLMFGAALDRRDEKK